MRKALLALAIAGVALLGTATPALAHNVLISSDPANGASVAAGPAKVTLTFDQYVQNADVNQIAVTGPDGNQWAEGPVTVENNVISAPLRPLGPAGKYTVGYRILSADGHPVSGEIPFTLTKAGAGTPAKVDAAKAAGAPASAAAGSASSSTGIPIWVWIAGAVVLLAIGLTVALRTGREPSQEKTKQ
ncbi:copper resistance CopC family protein [Amycolatopsis sp. FDAARGOS 1241]|uniref:copper resistance CopC family protein n=1 Tax=Amycolatopsis sp. FDAARGOS 1241 TaxID=2778070 RepID=UPI001950A31E|nr:copper resistance CopC family protein [Amycolatopsis sp. FDAARGOS 1241]QRP45950.1 copper resistance protein CopC [Amycolatopsis sp. FDAARGOS 1241]